MRSLTWAEARRRADLLDVSGYELALDLTGDERTFGSRTRVRFTARSPGTTFVDVKPHHLRSVRLDGSPLDPGSVVEGRLPLDLAAGEHELVVDAVMAYRHDGEGLHRSVDPTDGRHYTYAMSFLDAAPYIFACFDQPDLKAPYSVHVRTPRDWLVVGNGRADQVEAGRWELATTPPLSTYFVTLVAGPYHQVRSEHDGIALGLECRASLAEDLDRDAEELFTVTARCFDELHRLFGVRYAFGDYHQAFVPEFNAGAMESPGCVTLRDPLVFTSEVTRSERTTRATTIAHEMAHQWFGDLVTMRWWDDLWLNESFAEYLGNRVTHEATEFTDAWTDHAFRRKSWGLRADQRPSTHPVAGNGALDAHSALQDFDGISYVKGSAVLKQLNVRLGDEVFLSGLREYFRRHRFGNATMADLFAAWESAGAGDLAPWTQAWLRTAGPDLLEVDRTRTPAVLRRSSPTGVPADREHRLSLARYAGAGRWHTEPVSLAEEETPLPSLGGEPVVLDPADQTWARLGVDPVTAEALPELLPSLPDPVMRATVWTALGDGVLDARLDPRTVLDLVVRCLPREATDSGVRALSTLALDLADRLLTDNRGALDRVGEAAAHRMATADPASGVQLAALRTVVECSFDTGRLRGWLGGEDLPDGVAPDQDLRWRLLVRLACLGAVGRDELHAWLDREPTAKAAVELTRALASLPDEEAKAFAWDRFTGRVEVANYHLEAAGTGMWRRGQEEVTARYVSRYFADVPRTVEVRSGWTLVDAARGFYPRLAVQQATAVAAGRLLADPTLDPAVARAVTDETDDLRRALRARATFGL